MNEWRRTTFANSNFEIQNAAQLSVIKSQVSGVIRENANTAVFYRSQSAKNVQKGLTEKLIKKEYNSAKKYKIKYIKEIFINIKNLLNYYDYVELTKLYIYEKNKQNNPFQLYFYIYVF